MKRLAIAIFYEYTTYFFLFWKVLGTLLLPLKVPHQSKWTDGVVLFSLYGDHPYPVGLPPGDGQDLTGGVVQQLINCVRFFL